MSIELGLFDIHQVDPTDSAPPNEVFERRLALLELADRAGLKYAFTAERHFMANYWAPGPDRLDRRGQSAHERDSAGCAGVHAATAFASGAG